MKLRLIFAILILFPLVLLGQITEPQYKPTYVTPNPSTTDHAKSGVIFYSKGKMHVGYKPGETNQGKPASTAMYVDGSMKFATNSLIDQKGRTELTGDFINAKNPRDDNDSGTDKSAKLFIKVGTTSLAEKEGVVAFVGSTPRQWIYGVVNTTIGETITDWSGKSQKIINYMDFPTLSVEKSYNVVGTADDWRNAGVVILDQSVAASIQYLDVNTDRYSRFAIKAKNTPQAVLGDRTYINSAHALIRNLHPDLKARTNGVATYSQVYYDLYDYDGVTVDDGKFTKEDKDEPEVDSSTFGKSLRTENSHPHGEGWNYLVGFAPPFKELGADYMFYNLLTKPNAKSITSEIGPIVDPFYRMRNGYGYFMSMEVFHTDHDEDINNRWDFEDDYQSKLEAIKMGTGIHSERRARGGYVFNRRVFHDFLSAPKSTSLASTSPMLGSMDNMSRFVYDNSSSIWNPVAPEKPIVAANNLLPAHLLTGMVTNDEKRDFRPLGGLSTISGHSTGRYTDEWIEEDANGVDRDRSRYEYQGNETFNVDGGVEIELTEGLNFLGNPFMAPISLNPLFGYNVDGTSRSISNTDLENGFNVPELDVKASIKEKASGVGIRAKFWVINQALVRYNGDYELEYRTTYDFFSRDGASNAFMNGTKDGGNNGGTDPGNPIYYDVKIVNPLEYLISPMQIFCLQSVADGVKVKISKDLQVLGRGDARISKSNETPAIMKDWFIVEAESENGTVADRTSVIFRENAKPQMALDPYDTRKGIKDHENIVDEYGKKHTKVRLTGNSGIVYTKSSDAEPMLGNAVPNNTKELALFFVPPTQTQEMKLRFYNIENLGAVSGVWLIDRYQNNKTIRVEEGTEYSFVANAAGAEAKDANIDNRFILRFFDGETTSPEVGTDEISCYYSSSTLTVLGLNDSDLGSDLHIYDMQGRIMGKTKVSSLDMNSFKYLKSLSQGTYIVKIIGDRNYTAKFVNLRN